MNDPTPSIAYARREQARAWERDAGEPCSRCGVRPDVDCAHRPGSGRPPPAVQASKPKAISGGGRYRAVPHGQGSNFRRPKDPR